MEEKKTKRKRKKSFIKRKYPKAFDKQTLKIKMTEVLAAKFNLSKIEVLIAYEQFYRNFPEGFIMKEDYMEENKVNHHFYSFIL
jgi:hypothetical protein